MLLIVPQGLRLLSNAVERKVDASGKREQFERLHRLADRLPRFVRRLLFRPVLKQFGGRLRTFAVKDRSCADFPGLKPDGGHEDGVVLDMDYWVALPR